MPIVYTISGMSTKKRPVARRKSSDKLKSESLLVRLSRDEKRAFADAADLAGIALSAWVRERLRQAAVRELETAARPIAFLKHLSQE